ncbi:hypothetical protein [Streptomyces sp. NPDC048644]|uniref:hypothetical protein n=1 Tax=Streptomyces sp. NPDC048644 TaxID=3365582 RepID=UPI0037242FC0
MTVNFLGTITLSGLALATSLMLLLGLCGSDRVKINTRDKAGVWALITAHLWLAAGGQWANAAHGIGDVPKSVLGDGTFGNIGLGGIAFTLTILTFVPRWKRLIFPTLLSLSAATAYVSAGGFWTIFSNALQMVIGKLTGGA